MNESKRKNGWLVAGLLIVALIAGLTVSRTTKLLAAGNTIEVKGGSTVTFQGYPSDDRIVIDGQSKVVFDARTANPSPKPVAAVRRDTGVMPVSMTTQSPRPRKANNNGNVHNYYGNVVQYHCVQPEDLPEGRAAAKQMAEVHRSFGVGQ